MAKGKSKPKAYRQIGLVVYTPEELQRIIKLAEDAVDRKGNEKFEFIAWILHNKDFDLENNEIKKSHYHILLKLTQQDSNNNKNITIKAAAKKLQVEENTIEILECSYFGYLVKYLIHKQPKFQPRGQYTKEEIQVVRNKTGRSLDYYLDDNVVIRNKLDYYIYEITKNRMTLNDVLEEDKVFYCRNLPNLERAEALRVQDIIPETRVVYYITGKSGTGKTTLTKLLSKGLFLEDVKKYKIVDDTNLHKLMYFTGGKNVAFDNYKYQKVMVFDDVRDAKITDFGGAEEAFKIFNNQPNNESVNKKFGNVVITSEVMFLTNIENIHTFVSKVMKNQSQEIKNQLYRRIPVIVEVSENEIVFKVSNYIYSRLNKKYKGSKEHYIYQTVLRLKTGVLSVAENESIKDIKKLTKDFLKLHKNIEKVFKRKEKRKSVKIKAEIIPGAEDLFK
jgi:energy-coupling factor transporter ATP-binding protein EcfA2